MDMFYIIYVQLQDGRSALAVDTVLSAKHINHSIHLPAHIYLMQNLSLSLSLSLSLYYSLLFTYFLNIYLWNVLYDVLFIYLV